MIKMDMFRLNGKIELISEEDQRISGFIYDINDEKVYVSISADDEDFKLLNIGEKIDGAMYTKKELIGFEATVTARVFAKNSVYELSNIKNFSRIQRRENIRVVFTKDLLYTDNEFLVKQNFQKQGKKEVLAKLDKYLKDGLLLDLSAGGLKLSTSENFKEGQKLIFVINFEGQDMILNGKIVHKELNLVPKRTVYLYGVKFIDIKEGKQEKIIRYLFVMMRKNRIK